MARRASPIARWALGLLALGVAVLALSAAWAKWRPGREVRTHGPENRVVRVQVLNGSGEGGIGSLFI